MKQFKKGTKIVVNDKMQTGYSYILAENPGHTECRPRQRQALLQWAYGPEF